MAFVSVSMDEPDDRTRVIEFLNHQQADFDNLISSYGLGSEGFTKFEITNSVLPHFKIYDGNGELKHSCDSNQDLEVKIRSLLEH